MCGIFGYTGNKQALPIVLDGLRRLEYRGYDSAGVALPCMQTMFSAKAVGRIAKLEEALASMQIPMATAGIGHTRWATHGVPSQANAHPHSDCSGALWVCHNGIIENWRELRENLEKDGHMFRSETDTEVLPHLIEALLENEQMPLAEAVTRALSRVTGTFGVAVVHMRNPGELVVSRRSSPLIIGVGEKEMFVASDPAALLRHTKQVVYLDEDELAVLTPNEYRVRSLGRELRQKIPTTLEWSVQEAEKSGFTHFMQKEIFEGPVAIENAVRGRILRDEGSAKLGGLEEVLERMRGVDRLSIVSCGTSYYAGLVGECMLEEYADIPVDVLHASEFRYRKIPVDGNTAVLFVSQSGETADTLAALREAKRKGLLTLGMVNVVGSSIARETDAGVYNHAGPEIGVASTKAFMSQLIVFALLTVWLGRMRGMSQATGSRITDELSRIPQYAREAMKAAPFIEALAKKYAAFENFLYLGRKYNYPTALEGALKLKEISYIHAEGYPAGEMKHGPIALISSQFPTFAIAPRDSVYEKTVSGIEEVRARGGRVIALTTEGNMELERIADDVVYIPKTLEMLTPVLAVIPLQLFAYYIAVERGCDVDKPRNLAKSVTVE